MFPWKTFVPNMLLASEDIKQKQNERTWTENGKPGLKLTDTLTDVNINT